MDNTKENIVNSEHIYVVEVTETLNRLVAVKANSREEAIEKVETQYNSGEIELNSNDYADTEIKIYDYNDLLEIEEIISNFIKNEEMENLLKSYRRANSIILHTTDGSTIIFDKERNKE